MSDYQHADIEELLGVYALHALDQTERQLVDDHLGVCPRCAQEVLVHREVAALLGHSGEDAPVGLWERIVGELEDSPPALRLGVLPMAGAADRLSRGRPSQVTLAVLGIAAAVLIGVMGAVVVRQDTRIQDLESAQSDAAILPTSVAALSSADGTMTMDAVLLSNGTGYLLAEALPALTTEETYQLWGVTDTGVISLGLLGADPDRAVVFQAGDHVTGLAVTQEKAGGVAKSKNSAVLSGNFD
ncbi:MAG: hypothetical protein EXQ71_00275 [Acidimicrobiia bacterium]|nr:hypothetical protein [Acidimicrobiia bacterium]